MVLCLPFCWAAKVVHGVKRTPWGGPTSASKEATFDKTTPRGLWFQTGCFPAAPNSLSQFEPGWTLWIWLWVRFGSFEFDSGSGLGPANLSHLRFCQKKAIRTESTWLEWRPDPSLVHSRRATEMQHAWIDSSGDTLDLRISQFADKCVNTFSSVIPAKQTLLCLDGREMSAQKSHLGPALEVRSVMQRTFQP